MQVYVIAENDELELPIDYCYGQRAVARKLGVKKQTVASDLLRARKAGRPYTTIGGYRVEKIGEVPNNYVELF